MLLGFFKNINRGVSDLSQSRASNMSAAAFSESPSNIAYMKRFNHFRLQGH